MFRLTLNSLLSDDLEVTNSIDCARRNLAFATTMKLKVNIILKEILNS